LAQFLTEEIIATVDNLLDGVLEPVVFCWEGGIVGKSPVNGIIRQVPIGIRAIGNSSRDGLREWLSTSLSVETCLRLRGVLGSGDDAVKPVGDAYISTTIVGDVDYELLSTSCLEVLQTREEALLEVTERFGTEATKSQNTGLSVVQVVKLGDGVASTQWWQGGGYFRRERDV
jgi:hypothetical protein